jgi:hypothetical protein
MSKTKLVIKDNQVLIDAEVLFQEIRNAKGDWKRVEKEVMQMIEAFK